MNNVIQVWLNEKTEKNTKNFESKEKAEKVAGNFPRKKREVPPRSLIGSPPCDVIGSRPLSISLSSTTGGMAFSYLSTHFWSLAII